MLQALIVQVHSFYIEEVQEQLFNVACTTLYFTPLKSSLPKFRQESYSSNPSLFCLICDVTFQIDPHKQPLDGA